MGEVVVDPGVAVAWCVVVADAAVVDVEGADFVLEVAALGDEAVVELDDEVLEAEESHAAKLV